MKNRLILCILLTPALYAASEPEEQNKMSLNQLKEQYYEEVQAAQDTKHPWSQFQHTLKAQALLRQIEIEQETDLKATISGAAHAWRIVPETSLFGIVVFEATKKLEQKRFIPIPTDTSFINTALEIIKPWIPTPTTFLYGAGIGLVVWGMWRANSLFRAEFELEKDRLIHQFRDEVRSLREQIHKREEATQRFQDALQVALDEEKRLNDERAKRTQEELVQAKICFTQALAAVTQLSDEDVPALQMKQDEIEDLAQKIIEKQRTILDVISAMATRAHWDVTATARLKESREKAAKLGLRDDDPLADSVRRKTLGRRKADQEAEKDSEDEAEEYLGRGRHAAPKKEVGLWERLTGRG
jgi:hypothetical protein